MRNCKSELKAILTSEGPDSIKEFDEKCIPLDEESKIKL